MFKIFLDMDFVEISEIYMRSFLMWVFVGITIGIQSKISPFSWRSVVSRRQALNYVIVFLFRGGFYILNCKGEGIGCWIFLKG